MPDNEEDMQRLIREVKHQATIYRSLYKHWLEVADQVSFRNSGFLINRIASLDSTLENDL